MESEGRQEAGQADRGDELLVRSVRDVESVQRHGAVHVRQMFSTEDTVFKSSCAFVLYNRIAPGEVNERHSHDDVEKVHYVVHGEAVVECGEMNRRVEPGDFFFFPVGVPHRIRNTGSVDLEYVVVANRTAR